MRKNWTARMQTVNFYSEGTPALSSMIFSTLHHISGRKLPSIYQYSLPSLHLHSLPSLTAPNAPPKLPPKPSWLRKRSQEQGTRCRVGSSSSSFSDSSSSTSTLEHESLVGSDNSYEEVETESLELSEDKLLNKKEYFTLKKMVLEDELSNNEQAYLRIEEEVKSSTSSFEVEKLRSHNKDVEKIAALVFSLLRRLSRVERQIVEGENEFEYVMKKKRDKLVLQLEDAKTLKIFIEKRTKDILKMIKMNLGDSVCEQFEQFVNVKIKLIAKIKMAEENLR